MKHIQSLCQHIMSGILFIFMVTQVHATANSPEQILQEKLSAMHTLHAHFTQTIHAKKRLVGQSAGEMVLARPNRFRWQTLKPIAQLVIADGKKIWIYDPELEQVTVGKQTSKMGVAGALFLSQSADIVRENFVVTLQHKDGGTIFALRAKSEKSNFDQVRLSFKGNVLRTIALDDQLGQHTVIHLSNVRMNQLEPAHLFQFHIPAGVDVVHQ